MTIASILTSQQIACNGTATQFSFGNKIFLPTDLVVTLIDTLGNQYAFSNGGSGNVFSNGATGLSYTVFNVDVDTGCYIVFSAPPTNGWTCDMRTDTTDLQTTSIKNQGAFLPELHEEVFDRLTRASQDLERTTYTYGIHGPDIEATPWPTLPIASARKGLALVFDNNGLPVAALPTTQNLTLQQLAIFGTDSGAANAYVFTHSAPSLPATLAAGTLIRLTPLNTNNGPATLNADGSGAVAIIRANGSALTGGELSSLGPVVLQSTGTQWQIVSTAGAQPGYERSVAEIAAGVTPTNYAYPPNHIFRYITDLANVLAGTSSVDNSTGAQNWLTTLTPGCTATLIGVTRAQGLVHTVSDVQFAGGGWIKPISNVAATVFQIGSDSGGGTLVRRTRGLLRIGDKGANYTSWSNITGLSVVRATESNLGIDVYGVQNGMALLPAASSVAYNQFHLGDVYNCFVGLTLNPSGTGYTNNNRFYGGRFSADSGLWAAGNIDIQITAGATNRPNDNYFIGPTFEGAAQCWQCAGTDNHIIGARWEPGVGGLVPGTSCATIFWEYNDALATRNSVAFSYNSDWMNNPASSPYVMDLGAGTQVDAKDFTLTSGTDYTKNLFQGALANITIGGTAYLTSVVSSSYAVNTTFKTQTITASGNPTACWVVRISDQGTLNTWEIDNITGVTNSQAKVFRHMLQFWLNSSLCIQSQDAAHPAIRLMPSASSADPVLTAENLATAETFQLTGNGQLILKGSAAVAVSASQICLGNSVQTTVGASGTASATPANPQLYMLVFQGSTQYAIPLYKAS